MDHVVCAELAWAAARAGRPVLRFNFRGVGASQGSRGDAASRRRGRGRGAPAAPGERRSRWRSRWPRWANRRRRRSDWPASIRASSPSRWSARRRALSPPGWRCRSLCIVGEDEPGRAGLVARRERGRRTGGGGTRRRRAVPAEPPRGRKAGAPLARGSRQASGIVKKHVDAPMGDPPGRMTHTACPVPGRKEPGCGQRGGTLERRGAAARARLCAPARAHQADAARARPGASAVPHALVVDFRDGTPAEEVAERARRWGLSLHFNSVEGARSGIAIADGRRGRRRRRSPGFAVTPTWRRPSPSSRWRRWPSPPTTRSSPKQWNLRMIDMPEAWERSQGKGVVVAVIDTGIAYEDRDDYVQVPDLAGARFVPGYDFVHDSEHPNDDNGHGTHVAGTIAQRTNNGVGRRGHRLRGQADAAQGPGPLRAWGTRQTSPTPSAGRWTTGPRCSTCRSAGPDTRR